MAPELQTKPAPKWMFWTGCVLSALPALTLIASAIAKFVQPGDFAKGFHDKMGYPLSLAVPLGIVELTCTIIYLIPRTSVLGAILLTGYMGGAIATHVRVEQHFVAQTILGVLIWLGLYLRDARLRDLIPLRG